MSLTKILVALTGSHGYDNIRILRPLAWPGVKQALWDADVHVETKAMSEISQATLDNYHCLVMNGCPSPNVMNLLKKMPCPFALFEDDLMTRNDIPAWNPSVLSEASERALNHCLENACAIVATTQAIADWVGRGDFVRVQGNLEDFSFEPDFFNSSRFANCLYVGGNSHAGDLELLNDFQCDSGRMLVWSSTLPSARVAMFRDVKGNFVLKPNKSNWGYVKTTTDYELYQTYLKNLAPHFGFGLAPLVDCSFNRAKSCLKAVEYSKFGLIPVLSDVGPYRDWPDECCIKIRDGNWDNLECSSDVPRRAFEYAKANYSYQEKWRSWVETYIWLASKV